LGFAFFTLTVTLRGSANGTVTSVPAGIACPPICSANFTSEKPVTLNGFTGHGATFRGWGGACEGMAMTCVLTLGAPTAAAATFSKVFTDDPPTAGFTPIKAVHLTELQTAIDTLRARVSKQSFVWSEPNPQPKITLVKAVHITDLCNALKEAYPATNCPYTGPVALMGQRIQAAHLSTVRAAVRALE
jgi:hypothetical protein